MLRPIIIVTRRFSTERRWIPNPHPTPGGPDRIRRCAIVLDPAGVWALPIDNPNNVTYPAGSAAANLNSTFNYTYTSLLKSLHSVFNGAPTRLGEAIGLMESMKEQALGMMSVELAGGKTAGPSRA